MRPESQIFKLLKMLNDVTDYPLSLTSNIIFYLNKDYNYQMF
jgi:hypothetical protein